MADKYLLLEQDGVEYNLYEMPKGFVIKGDLDLSRLNLSELPELSEVVVEGKFDCSYNKLTTLEGAPQEVGGYFDCGYNQLTSLKGAPKKVERGFNCSYNQLTTLEGAPQKVGGEFNCSYNQLTTLEGAPKEVGGGFGCYDNQLTTLEGAPKTVGIHFYCFDNQLTSLIGVPQLQKGKKIKCDNILGEKYGFSDSKFESFTFEQLSESALYKSEVAADRVRRKMAQERAEKQQQATENTKAAFDAWLKNKGIESPER